jgi:hypothetical protein
MKALRVGLAVLTCLLAFNQNAFSQLPLPEADIAASILAANKLYAEAFPVHPQLYNGPEYIDYSKAYHSRLGHQFFLSSEKQPGSVFYNQHVFDNVQLMYDIVLDQVLLSPPQSPLMLSLVNENLGAFYVDGHLFTRLVADSVTKGVIRTGFYEVLLDKSIQVLAKRAKRKQEHFVQRYIDVEFTAKNALFIKKAGVYYPASRKSAAMRLFSDRGKEMQEYVKDHQLSFKKDQFESTLVQLAGYYSGLLPR